MYLCERCPTLWILTQTECISIPLVNIEYHYGTNCRCHTQAWLSAINYHTFLLFQATASNKKAPSTSLWYRTDTIEYTVGGGRDVLILAPDLSLSHPEAVARRPGQLTEEDKLKLQSQGLPHDCQNELDITRARYELDKRCNIVEIKLGKSPSQDEIIQSIEHLLNTTQNDGGKDFLSLMA